MNQLINAQVADFVNHSSMIRRMFEAGIELRKTRGADRVYDFSLGNPDLPPPKAVSAALHEIADAAAKPFSLGYMPNPGYPDVRAVVAERVTAEQGVKVEASHVIMSVGAAGGINSLFRAILEPGDEVLCPAPYFVEYGFYASNFGGKLKTVPCKDFTFELDVPALAAAIGPKTKAVIINSPNNPTGQIYPASQIAELADALRKAEEKFGTAICLIADEPYRFLNYEGVEIPSVLSYYNDSVVIGSYSKNLSLAGERLGYIAVNPAMHESEKLVSALALTTRILGFVNAPCIGQQILRKCAAEQVDLEIYRERRAAMAAVLDGAGIKYTMPRGAFYFFAKAPMADDKEFCQKLMSEGILAVPGSGFGCAGYIRLAFCVDKKVINGSAEGFKKVMQSFK